MTTSIVVEYDLPNAPAKVWRTLTEPRLLAAWLMDNDIAPVVGHRFQFRSEPMPHWSGIVDCEVLAVRPHRLLKYTWRSGDLESVVTWTLEPTPHGGTLLRLDHAGFTGANEWAFQAMTKGWREKGPKIAALSGDEAFAATP